jgi:hypothetical protein
MSVASVAGGNGIGGIGSSVVHPSVTSTTSALLASTTGNNLSSTSVPIAASLSSTPLSVLPPATVAALASTAAAPPPTPSNSVLEVIWRDFDKSFGGPAGGKTADVDVFLSWLVGHKQARIVALKEVGGGEGGKKHREPFHPGPHFVSTRLL